MSRATVEGEIIQEAGEEGNNSGSHIEPNASSTPAVSPDTHPREPGPGLPLAIPGREVDIASQKAATQIHREDTPSSVGTILSAATDPRMGAATSQPEYPPVEAPETTVQEQRVPIIIPKREREP
jgi:hypothetical protein